MSAFPSNIWAINFSMPDVEFGVIEKESGDWQLKLKRLLEVPSSFSHFMVTLEYREAID